jgi:hypothetical protein
MAGEAAISLAIVGVDRRWRRRRLGIEQAPAKGELGAAAPVGEEAISPGPR